MNKTNNLVKKIVEPIYMHIYRSHSSGLLNLITRQKLIRFVGFITTSTFLLLTFLSIFPIISHNDSAEATPGVVEVPTISITSASNIASVDIVPTSSTGTFATSTSENRLSFDVTTSNYTGYTLTIEAGDDSGLLTNSNTADTLSSITTATDATTFATGSTSDYNNKWGYKPNIFNSVANTNYLPAPTTTASTLNHTTTANTSSDTYTIDLGARVDYTKPSGTYTNTYVLTATANPVAYAIEYYNMSGTYTTGDDNIRRANFTTIATQASENNTLASITLAPGVTPTRNDGTSFASTYTFAGWCKGTTHSDLSVNDTTTYNTSTKIYSNPATQCNGTIYNTGASMPIDPTIDNTNIKLYAVWTPTTVAQAYGSTTTTMQNMTSTICNKITPNQWGIVTDSRDSQSYHIARLEDGRCWMLDNLNLDVYSYRNTLSTSNTHTTDSTALARFRGSGTMSSSDRYPTAAITSGWTTTNSYSAPLQNRSGKCDPSINGSYYPCTKAPSGVTNGYQGNNYNYNTVIDRFSSSGSSSAANIYYNIGPGSYKVGTFYNFCATTGGYYCWGNGMDAGSHTESTNYNIANDICPASWRLPKSGTISYPTANYDEYKYLHDTIAANYPETYNTSTSPLSIQSMLSTSLAGFYRSGTAYNQGSGAYYWTSTYVSIADIYYAHSGVIAFSSNTPSAHRYDGMSIRCIAQ